MNRVTEPAFEIDASESRSTSLSGLKYVCSRHVKVSRQGIGNVPRVL